MIALQAHNVGIGDALGAVAIAAGSVFVLFFFFWLMFLPYRLAKSKGNPNKSTILVLCFLPPFLWIIAMIWAIFGKSEAPMTPTNVFGNPARKTY